MYKLHCPNCRKSLSSEKRLPKAKLRCPHCGVIFIGSTDTPDSGQIVSAAPALAMGGGVAHAYHKTTGPVVRSNWPLYVVPAAAIVAVGLLIAVIVAYPSRPRSPQRAAGTADDESSRPRQRGGGPAETGLPITGEPYERTDTEPPEQAAPTPDTGEDHADEHVRVVGLALDRSSGGRVTYAIGQVRNLHAGRGLDRVTVAVDIRGEDGRPVDSRAVTCRYVPAGHSIPFSIAMSGVMPDADLADLSASSRLSSAPAWLGDDKACLYVPPSSCTDRVSDGVYELVVRATNTTDSTLTDLRLYIDFYRGGHGHLRHIQPFEGPLDVGGPVEPGIRIETLPLTFPDLKMLPGRTSFVPRIVARRVR